MSVKCELATDGKEALECVKNKFKEFGTTYSLIIMDYNMPIWDGLEASKMIRMFLDKSQVANNCQPFICLATCHHEKIAKFNLDDYGIDYKVLKPMFKKQI